MERLRERITCLKYAACWAGKVHYLPKGAYPLLEQEINVKFLLIRSFFLHVDKNYVIIKALRFYK